MNYKEYGRKQSRSISEVLRRRCFSLKLVNKCVKKFSVLYTVTYRPTARQRLGKHIPAEAYARTIGRQSLGNGSVNKLSQQ
jgi:hypothetical protein